CDFGSLEGKPILDVMRENRISRKEQLKKILPDDGEQWSSLLDRGERILGRVNELQENNHSVALVSHDAVIQGLSELLTGSWFDAAHGEIYKFNPTGGNWVKTNC
ncbi:MAG: histidine phosphatase family protein, partial [Pseudomonadota bacterium]